MSTPETGIVKQQTQLARPTSFAPTTFQEAMEFSKMVAHSDLAPKDYRDKPANVLIAIQMGSEVGLSPMAALQNIAVINGRPALWGDAALAVVQVHPAYEWHKEYTQGEGDAMTAICQIKRKGSDVSEGTFSVAQAKKAELWTKQGPWTTYPDRMLKMRARGFALRDKFADALRGLITAEEAMDLVAIEDPRGPAPEGVIQKKSQKAATSVSGVQTPIEAPQEAPAQAVRESPAPQGTVLPPENASDKELPGCITEKQQKLVWTVARSARMDPAALRVLYKEKFGIERTKQLPKERMNELLDILDPAGKFHTSNQPPQNAEKDEDF